MICKGYYIINKQQQQQVSLHNVLKYVGTYVLSNISSYITNSPTVLY